MAFKYSTDWLIEQAIRYESVATSDVTFNTQDLIQFLETELVTTVTPICQSVNEEFGVFYEDVAISGTTVSIPIPSFATGQRLRSVNIVSTGTNQFLTQLPRLNPEQIASVILPPWGGFYLRNNELVFYPTPITNPTVIRLSYYRRPNELVETQYSGRVLSIDTILNTVVLDNAPPSNYWSVGDEMDIIISKLPFDFRVKNALLISKAGTTLEFDPAVIAQMQIGDIVALNGESPVAQFIPGEAHYLLAQLAAGRCLQAYGDTEGSKVAMAKAEEMKANLLNLMSDRVQDQPKKIVTNAGIAAWSAPFRIFQGGR